MNGNKTGFVFTKQIIIVDCCWLPGRSININSLHWTAARCPQKTDLTRILLYNFFYILLNYLINCEMSMQQYNTVICTYTHCWYWLKFTPKPRNSTHINNRDYVSPVQSCNIPWPQSGQEQNGSRCQRPDNPFYRKSNQLISFYLGVLRPSHLMPVNGSITRLFTFLLKALTCLE